MKQLLLAFAIFSVAAQSYAWTGTKDFEDGAVGSPAFDFYKDTTYSKDYVHSGSKSGKSFFPAGSSAKYTGGNYKFPKDLSEGDQLWFRMYLYVPSSFNFSAQPVAKLMRVKNGSGHTSLLWRGSNGTIQADNELDISKFVNNNPNYRSLSTLEKGKWQPIEMYLKFSSKGGNGIFRVWHKGKLVMEDRKTPTLSPGYGVPGAIFFTYWNGGSPASQSMYVDDIVWTSETPSSRDASGNPFIGLGKGNASSSTPEPEPVASPPVAPKITSTN